MALATTPAAPEAQAPRMTPPATSEAPAAPATPPARYRLLHAWSVTIRVLLSYLWVQLTGRLRSKAGREEALLRCHRRNARRVARALTRLQGLFVKVGQLLSMLTSFLPEDF